MNYLDQPVISSIRRNHALEHASLTILSQRNPRLSLAGISFPWGFYVFGEVDQGELREAVFQGLARLQSGEQALAVHPNCGTNFVASGVVAGLLAWLGLAGARDQRQKWERLPLVISLVTLAFIFTRPLGPLLQEKVTTQAEPGSLTVTSIQPLQLKNMHIHRVSTRG